MRLASTVASPLRRDAELKDRELISAEAGNRIDVPYGIFQTTRHCLQDTVADQVPQGVVHHLELIEVQTQQRKPLAPLGLRQCLVQPILEDDPVGQLGLRIVPREEDDLFLRFATLRNVFMDDNQAAVRHGLVRNRDRSTVGERSDGSGTLAGLKDRRPLRHDFVTPMSGSS